MQVLFCRTKSNVEFGVTRKYPFSLPKLWQPAVFQSLVYFETIGKFGLKVTKAQWTGRLSIRCPNLSSNKIYMASLQKVLIEDEICIKRRNDSYSKKDWFCKVVTGVKIQNKSISQNTSPNFWYMV